MNESIKCITKSKGNPYMKTISEELRNLHFLYSTLHFISASTNPPI